MAKSQQFYDVTIRTDVERMQTILKVVEGSATLIGVVPVTEGSPTVKTPKARKVTSYINGVRNKGIKASDLIIKTLKESSEAVSPFAMEKVFTDNGFAASSCSSSLSVLRSEGRIRRLVNGYWEFVK